MFGALLDENHESKKDVSTCLQQTLNPAEVKRRLFNLVKDKVDPMSETLKFSIFETVDMLMKTGYIETFSFKDWEAAFEMVEIIRVLLPYFNPEDLTGHVSTFIERLREKTRNEFGSIVPLELRNLGLINMCENHPLKEGGKHRGQSGRS